MGNKGAKAQVNKLLRLTESEETKKKGASKQELAACLATLSDMAQTGARGGIQGALDALPGASRSDFSNLSDEQMRDVGRQLTSRLRHNRESDVEDIEELFKQLNLVDSQEDSRDWATMRNWLVWCMHTNLDNMAEDDDVITEHAHSRVSRRHKHMRRQTSVDATRPKRRLSHQISLDADLLAGRVTAQSSLESNGET